MVRRTPTKPNTCPWVLTPQQLTAVDLLASGKTLQATADAIEVSRPTVSGWVNHEPAFQAALNQRRQDLWADAADRLRGLLPRALDVLAQALEGETPVPAAVAILKAAGLHGLPPPTGATDPRAVAIEQGAWANLRAYQLERVADGSHLSLPAGLPSAGTGGRAARYTS